MKNRLLLFITLMFFLTLSGCRVQNDFENPEVQFVFIKNDIKVFVCKKEADLCLPMGSGTGMASGVLVSHSSNNSYYLTAGHVCDMELPPTKNGFYSKYEEEIHLFDQDGEDTPAEVVAVDEENDICLLSSKRVSHAPAVVEKRHLKKHMKIINVAAPAGIWSKDVMIHFIGEFQGNYQNPHNKESSKKVALYAIAAQKGSSGSPVYDPKTGRLIGLITSVLTPSYDVAFGPTLEQINDFLDRNLPS